MVLHMSLWLLKVQGSVELFILDNIHRITAILMAQKFYLIRNVKVASEVYMILLLL